MAVPISQMWTVASLRAEAEACRAQALSAGADAGAAVPLQPGLRRLRQDPVSGAHPEDTSSRRKSASARWKSAARRWCRIPGGEPLMHPQIDEIVEGLVARKKYIYLCTNALLLKEKARPVQAEQVPDLLRPRGRRSASTTISPSAAKAATTWRLKALRRPSSAASASPPTPPCSTAPIPTACATSSTR